MAAFFHGDRSVIGREVDLRGAPFTVVGVMPRGFHTDAPSDFWTPLQPNPADEGNYQIIGRLHPGVTLAAASGQLTSIAKPALDRMYLAQSFSFAEKAVPLQTGSSGASDSRSGMNLRRQAFLIWAAVGLALLIGCINVAGLLLSRTSMRRREITTRLALGATRRAIIRQLLTEALLLAAGGGLIGLFLGELGTEALGWLSFHQFNFWNPVRFDLRVGFVSFAIALATGVVFGLVPALQATKIDLRSGLAEAGRTSAGNRRHWLAKTLIFIEVALGVMLVISAGLLLRSFAGLVNANPGFVPQNVIAASVSLNDARYANTAAGVRLFRDTLDRIRQIPGVQSAAVALTTPYQRALQMGLQAPRPPHGSRMTDVTYASPGLFETLRIPFLRGRSFTEADGSTTLKVAIVNTAFLQRFFPNNPNPLGQEIKLTGTTYRIAGIVGNVQQKNTWGGTFAPVAPLPQAYIPAAQFPNGTFRLVHTWFSPSFVIRTRGHITGLNQQLQQAIAAVDPRLPFSSFQNMAEVRSTSLSEQRYLAVLFSTLAGLALLLAAIGIYGLIAQSVAQRTREMGIRLALGATAHNIVRQTAAPGILLSAAGVACGLLLSAFATRLLASFIWGISTTDPITYTAVALLLLAVAAMASLLPALRLARIDPAQTLRDE